MNSDLERCFQVLRFFVGFRIPCRPWWAEGEITKRKAEGRVRYQGSKA